jgi:hypothetical protein
VVVVVVIVIVGVVIEKVRLWDDNGVVGALRHTTPRLVAASALDVEADAAAATVSLKAASM